MQKHFRQFDTYMDILYLYYRTIIMDILLYYISFHFIELINVTFRSNSIFGFLLPLFFRTTYPNIIWYITTIIIISLFDSMLFKCTSRFVIVFLYILLFFLNHTHIVTATPLKIDFTHYMFTLFTNIAFEIKNQ